MPYPRLTQPDAAFYRMTVEIMHHAYDLWPTVEVAVKCFFTDETEYTIARWERDAENLDRLPDIFRDLADAFLWGDGARGVVSVVAAEDASAQSRRVRRVLPPG